MRGFRTHGPDGTSHAPRRGRSPWPENCNAFNATRYAWVKKRFEQTDVAAGTTAQDAIVSNIRTRYGAWPDVLN
jgi:hypothetical protein